LDTIDAEGLENFSIRNLAAKLGVYPTALYWYVPSRNELLAEVVTLMFEEIVPTRRFRSWQNLLRDLFDRFRAAIRAHPNVAPLVGTQLVANSSVSFAFIEKILATLSRAGLKGNALVGAYNAVLAALVGFVAQEFAPAPAEDAVLWRDRVQSRLIGLDRKAYPVLAENLQHLSNRAFILRWQNGTDAPLDDSFSLFVEVIIDGIESLIERAQTQV
jgi:AcrR family transcriptional regulator